MKSSSTDQSVRAKGQKMGKEQKGWAKDEQATKLRKRENQKKRN